METLLRARITGMKHLRAVALQNVGQRQQAALVEEQTRVLKTFIKKTKKTKKFVPVVLFCFALLVF